MYKNVEPHKQRSNLFLYFFNDENSQLLSPYKGKRFVYIERSQLFSHNKEIKSHYKKKLSKVFSL